MAYNFQNFFFGQLPLYYKVNDTYRDINDRGLLERFLEIFGMEINEEVTPLVENYLKIINPFETDPKYLTTLGYTMGSPPDLLGDPDAYAKILAYIIQVYKIKGTAKAYELLFSLIGFNITISELPPDEWYTLDDGTTLDMGARLDNGCPPCSEYEVVINPLLTPATLTCSDPIYTFVPDEILPTFIKIIEFNQPINAHLAGIVNGGKACEEVNLCVENIININLLKYTILDSNLKADSGETLDTQEKLGSSAEGFDCHGRLFGVGIGFMAIGTSTFKIS
jgi:hypothetical protein